MKDRLNDSRHRAVRRPAAAAVHRARAGDTDPSVLLLDEPTASLDPISTQKVEELVYELRGT